MACCCNFPRLFRATTVEVADGVTTITIPSSPEINAGDVIDVGLFATIPIGTDGTELTITNGTVTGNVMACNGNYFRPLPLTSRTILRVQYFGDPAHFQILGIRRSR